MLEDKRDDKLALLYELKKHNKVAVNTGAVWSIMPVLGPTHVLDEHLGRGGHVVELILCAGVDLEAWYGHHLASENLSYISYEYCCVGNINFAS